MFLFVIPCINGSLGKYLSCKGIFEHGYAKELKVMS